MAKDWQTVASPKAALWGVPQSALSQLDLLTKAAEAALGTAQNEATRTPVATAQCREAFDALVSAMRDFKRRYFLSPPLADSDYIALGLKPRDATPTPSGTPAAQASIETYLKGRHELGVRIVYISGSPNDPANKGYRIWYSVVPQGQTLPASPGELRNSFFTKRKKDVMEFDFGDSGKTCAMAVQIENEGKKGPWGPLVNALIP
jgi:hypothetical protein